MFSHRKEPYQMRGERILLVVTVIRQLVIYLFIYLFYLFLFATQTNYNTIWEK